MSRIPIQNIEYYYNVSVERFRNKDYRSWILLNPASVGDTWLTCALAKAFVEQHGGPITMVVKEGYRPIAEMYNNDIINIISVQHGLYELCERVHSRSHFCIDEPIVVHPYFVGDGRLGDLIFLRCYPNRGGLDQVDMWRFMLHLTWDAPLAKPEIPEQWVYEAVLYANKIGMDPGRSVILFPDCNSTAPFPDEFWIRLANRLGELGWMVFTNMVGNNAGPRQAPFPGTRPVTVSLRLALPLLEYAGRWICGPNGLAYMAAGCNVKSQGTYLIPQGAPDLFVLKTPEHQQLRLQSLQNFHITDSPPREYVVRPHEDMTSIIEDIAIHNPETALCWRNGDAGPASSFREG